MLKNFGARLVVVFLVGILTWNSVGLTKSYAWDGGVSTAYNWFIEHGFKPLWGDTHNHGYYDDGTMAQWRVYREGLLNQDFLIHTPHAEQVTVAEADLLNQAAADHQKKGKLLGIGYEWTGTTETIGTDLLNLDLSKYNPGHDKSNGHVLVYGTKTRIGQMSLRDGFPDKFALTFRELLLELPSLSDKPIGVFAHPALYKPDESFDLDGQAPGYDPPPSPESIAVMRGCELSKHGPPGTDASGGLGDGVTLATSNEACYRRLLRGGWELSPYMSTDNHMPGYPTSGPWTCVWARERSIDAIYDAMEERLTCGTEARQTSITMVTQQCVASDSNPTDPHIVPMGGSMTLLPEADKIFCWVSLQDKAGKPVVAKECGLVEVFREQADDIDMLALERERRKDRSYREMKERQEKFDNKSRFSFLFHLYKRNHGAHVTSDQSLRCVYAKATLPSGKQLITAPVFFRY